MDHSENLPTNPSVAAGRATILDLVAIRMSRRGFVSGAVAAAGMASAGCQKATNAAEVSAWSNPNSAFKFQEVPRGSDETHHLPPGYAGDILIRWGDPLFEDAPAFDAERQSPDAQRRQFGYNNDYVGFIPLQARDGEAERALLCVNHEYTSTALMFPGLGNRAAKGSTRDMCEIEMAAHGGSVIEIFRIGDTWSVDRASRFNRRITADTPMRVSGPAAGDARLRTRADPTGTRVLGTLNNCAGGITPWGTFLMAEENFNGNFMGSLAPDHREAANHQRYGVPAGWYDWGRHFDRFDVAKEPNEPNRFGWMVEVDPLDPASTPIKRTALGRFKHEGAESVVARDGRVVFYMGDDQRFDYVYKFVTKRPFRPGAATNADLLDEGTLYVARFDATGDVHWLALTHAEGPLTPANGFRSQADVVIEARRAADLLGATPMDRPEDVEPHPTNGRVYVMLTNNTARKPKQIDAANPRAENRHGHIIEIIEADGDYTSTRSRWDMLILCGDPASASASWNPMTSSNGWFSSPDNCAIDPLGRLWVATDGNENSGAADGFWAIDTAGPARGAGTGFFRAPVGAEVCGPCFAPDGRTLFLAVQHPGDVDNATYETPGTRWPDFSDRVPPRPSVLAIRRRDGGVIGG